MKYKTIWTKIKLNSSPVYNERYISTKIRTFGDKVYANFRGLNLPKDDIECESFIGICIDFLLVYDKDYYLELYLDNFAYKVVNKQMTDYLGENLFKDKILEMLYYDRVDINKGIDLAKSNNSKECMICHYWFFNYEFSFKDYVCNGCHDLTILSVNINDVPIITVKDVDYRCIIHNITKSQAINLLKNSVLEDHGHT